MIASVAFRNFKALRNAGVRLAPFNLLLGPNGSGKSSLIEALQHLRSLSRLAPSDGSSAPPLENSPDISFQFTAPYDSFQVRLACINELACNSLYVTPADPSGWNDLRGEIFRIRSYIFEHLAISCPARRSDGAELAANGGNLAAVIGKWRDESPHAYAAFVAETIRLFPEFRGVDVVPNGADSVAFSFTLTTGGTVESPALSQGMLYTLAILALTLAPSPPSVVCIEEVDRGVHPRMLREIRDALYRLSYPASFGLTRPPVQVIATTHSPYFLDLLRDHPDEVVISQKRGTEAHFERLSDRADLNEILAEGSLGDLWYSGILGGVPEENQ